MAKSSFVEDSNLSHAWARAIRPMLGRGGVRERAPLVVSITGFEKGIAVEDQRIRNALDALLRGTGKQSCHTVANTIFPESLWNPSRPREEFFERYRLSQPRIKQASTKNKHGMYFDRLVRGGPEKYPNQLDFIVEQYLKRKSVRRSALQVAVYDATRDQTTAAQRGFPCLQHVTFAPTEGGLNVNAFYATQYVFERAYGNYLGLCRLGRFVAHELNLKLACVTCFTGIMLRDPLAEPAQRKLARVLDATVDVSEGGR